MTHAHAIQTALDNCRAAFAAHPEASWAWCCHHEIEVEPLTEPAENRIQFILENKNEDELVTRFNNFRPVLSALPKGLLKARAEYDKAWAEYDKAKAEYASELAPLHKTDVPDHTWNGKSIF